MPQDVQFEAYLPPPPPPGFAAPAPLACMEEPAHVEYTPKQQAPRFSRLDALRGMFRKSQPAPSGTAPESIDDDLITLASQLEPDGGMPGQNASERSARSVALLLALVAAGHTITTGAFRAHVARLVQYLTSLNRRTFDVAIQAASTGKVPPGDWLAVVRDSGVPLMMEVEKALKS